MHDVREEGACFAAFREGLRPLGFYTTEKAAKARVVAVMKVRRPRWDAVIPTKDLRDVGVSKVFRMRSPEDRFGLVYEVKPVE
jgi:hypothetical protein